MTLKKKSCSIFNTDNFNNLIYIKYSEITLSANRAAPHDIKAELEGMPALPPRPKY